MSITRDVTVKARNHLKSEEILLFIGARQAGKTTILKQLQAILEEERQAVYFLNLEDPDYLALLNDSPKNLFKIFHFDFNKKFFLLIDEIQYLNNPSNFLKYFYDEYQGKIKLLASGSSAFYIDEKFKDSLAGRKKIFNVLTLSFREFLRFKKESELARRDFVKLALAEKEKIIFYYQEYIVYGGYPRAALASMGEKIEILRDIAYSYIKKDVFESGVKQEEVFYKLIKILASQTGHLVNVSELAATLNVSKTAVDNYLRVMQKSFHIKLIAPFFRNIRKELTKMQKVFFLDLGLRNFFVDNFKPFALREDRGELLENAVFRQLLEQYDPSEIKFWRTAQKHELDFVVKDKIVIEAKAQPGQFKNKNIKLFSGQYKNFDFFIASFNIKEELAGRYKFKEVWSI